MNGTRRVASTSPEIAFRCTTTGAHIIRLLVTTDAPWHWMISPRGIYHLMQPGLMCQMIV
jgi:hypothetical protein